MQKTPAPLCKCRDQHDRCGLAPALHKFFPAYCFIINRVAITARGLGQAFSALARNFLTLLKTSVMKRLNLLLTTLFLSVLSFAQEGGGADLNVDVTKSTSTTTSSFPWTWVIIGAVVLILLIVILSSGGGGTDRVVEKKTVIKD